MFEDVSTEQLLMRLQGYEEILRLSDETIRSNFDVEGRPYFERKGQQIKQEIQRRAGIVREPVS